MVRYLYHSATAATHLDGTSAHAPQRLSSLLQRKEEKLSFINSTFLNLDSNIAESLHIIAADVHLRSGSFGGRQTKIPRPTARRRRCAIYLCYQHKALSEPKLLSEKSTLYKLAYKNSYTKKRPHHQRKSLQWNSYPYKKNLSNITVSPPLQAIEGTIVTITPPDPGTSYRMSQLAPSRSRLNLNEIVIRIISTIKCFF
ncbi:hypothetical protein TNCV_2078751 [Trichonephila clavipes]|nr:hypothetical protein TNCV_2078751 [Trichonephila clavipes]